MIRLIRTLVLFLMPIAVVSQTQGIDLTDADSLKQVFNKAETSFQKVTTGAIIAELYSMTGQSDSAITYRDAIYEQLHLIDNRIEKEEAYLKIIEAIILDMNLDSFAQAALNYIESTSHKGRIYLVFSEYYFTKEGYDGDKCLAITDTAKFYLEQAPQEEDFLVNYHFNRCLCHQENFDLLAALEDLLMAERYLQPDHKRAVSIYNMLAYVYHQLQAYEKALEAGRQAKAISTQIGTPSGQMLALLSILDAALALKDFSLVKTTAASFFELHQKNPQRTTCYVYAILGETALAEGQVDLATSYFNKGLESQCVVDLWEARIHEGLSEVWYQKGKIDSAQYQVEQALSKFDFNHNNKTASSFRKFAKVYAAQADYKTAYEYIAQDLKQQTIADSLNNPFDIVATLLNQNFEQEKTILNNQIKQRNLLLWILVGIALAIIAVATIFYRNSQIRKRLVEQIKAKNKAILAAQDQLIMQEKLASLGQLTAGIAHEIKNPLNFINNFAEGSVELHLEFAELFATTQSALPVGKFEEMKALLEELKLNAADIQTHGQRVDKIVKNMMNHSRADNSLKEITAINQLIVDNSNLAYHGFRTKEPTFVVHYEQLLTPDLPAIKVFKQAINRALLNLLNNACYAVFEKQKSNPLNYNPIIKLVTRQEKQQLIIKILDNGNGIPEEIRDQIFNPFFTTKPPNGINTGLGLSITHDIIVKQHGGKISVSSTPNEFTEFTICLPM